MSRDVQNGMNALHLAAKEGHADVVSELLARGAAVDSATKVRVHSGLSANVDDVSIITCWL